MTRTAQKSFNGCGLGRRERLVGHHQPADVPRNATIAVNDEPGALTALLETAPDVLKPGGRIGVISFHSVEDKPVKLDFRRRKNERVYDIVTKKPITASEQERATNPRSRSAKLRVAVRVGEA